MAPFTKPGPLQGCILQLRHERTSLLNVASTTDDSSKDKDKKILFGRVDAAEKFVREKVRAVLKAKHLISVAWFEVEDHVYDTASNPIKELGQVYVAETETIDDLQNRLRTLKVSRASPFRGQAELLPIPFEFRLVAESMNIAANRWVSRQMLKRDRARGTPKNRNITIKMEGYAREVSDWSWNDDTEEENWEDLGFELHHAEISRDERCYNEQPSVKPLRCYRPSLLRWSLTVRGD